MGSCRSTCVMVLGALLLTVLWPQRGAAHRTPVPLAFWGGFDAPTARCQRIIAAAAARCGLIACAARNACLRQQVHGDTCDMVATDATVSQAHATALSTVDHQCDGG